MNLRALLLKDFGIDFPISGGCGGSFDNAIVVHRVPPNNYVATEHAILRCLGIGRRITWTITGQEVLRPDGKAFDRITITTKSEDGSGTIERYYFDVTECFGA
jgi:hypothetical protein